MAAKAVELYSHPASRTRPLRHVTSHVTSASTLSIYMYAATPNYQFALQPSPHHRYAAEQMADTEFVQMVKKAPPRPLLPSQAAIMLH